ncbi:minichromosome maintenance- protein [Bulinus truncatus]|nr:minichromosome maintenance- protein [Bulinus truncatus]
MTSNDELCDQATLEAMLDSDDDSDSQSCNPTATNIVKSIEDFFNAHSDDSDEEDAKNKNHPKKEDSDNDEAEILASLICDDSDMEETFNVRAEDKGSQGSPASETKLNLLKKEAEKTTGCVSKTSRVSTVKSSPVTSKSREGASVVNRSHSKAEKDSAQTAAKHREIDTGQAAKIEKEQTSVILSTQTIQEEMLKMQAKMLELQRMLEMQQSQQACSQTEPHSSTDIQPKNSPSSKTSQNASHKKSDIPVKKADTKGITSQIKLVSDNDDFFSPGSSQTSKKLQSRARPTEGKTESSKVKRSQMEAELFGDSDSDWEGMDGEDKRNLSEAGRELKQIMQSSERKREAHQPKFTLGESVGAKSSSWKNAPTLEEEKDGFTIEDKKEKMSKNVLQCKTSSSSQAKSATPAAEDEKIYVEEFSKIRIVNPLISSSLMRMRMEGRKLISSSRIHLKLKTPDLQGDWVTIAVVVGKTDSKASSTGKPYCIWKLNDLEDLDNCVSFFLFGEVHKHLWKTEVGTVIGVLNPSIMESMEKNNSEPAFTIKNPNQLMIMGRSKDLGWCIARTKSGNKCVKFINKKFGDFCSFHVAAEYRKTSAQRLELHGSVSGMRPKSFEKKVFAKDCAYIYGGNTYVPNSSQKGKKNGVTLNKLQHALLNKGKHQKINTLTINEIKPEPASAKTNGKIQDDKDAIFMDLISVPSPGSMNLVAFLKKNENKPVATSTPLPNRTVESITAKDLIKQHQQAMQQKLAEKKKKASELLLASSQVSSPTATLKNVADPLKEVPKLGKGFYSGQQISLDVNVKTSVADRTKLKALAAIRSKGGLKGEDPNAVRKTEGVDMEKIKKRLCEDNERSPAATDDHPNTSAGGQKLTEPPKKKARLLGNVDLNSDEVKSILKAKSKHKGALAEAEAEREEVYFKELEKKEKLEEKMQSVTSIEIKVVTCKQCLYTAQSALDSCKKENHTLVSSKAKKRFFMCKKCKHRTSVIGGKFPTEACSKCGTLAYEKTSMYKIRTGPKLESEVLNIRGDEIKFINSLEQKVFLNTVIDH